LKTLFLSTVCAANLAFSSIAWSHGDMDWSNITAEKNQYLDIPDLGSQVGLISRQQEKQIGEKVLRQVRQQLPEIQDAWLEDEINQIFASIYSQTNMGKPIALVVVRDQQINAFAVPGGLFAINAGTITASHNIDEIAGVMAHEIAHVTQRHYSRSQEAFKGQGLLALAGLLAGIAVASQSSDAGAAVMLGSQAAMLDRQLSYSRNQEREADRVGMQYMAIAGYNPESMADFFELMQRSSTQLSYLPDFWLTHPLTAERMSEARLRARQYNVKINNSLEKQQKFELIRWRTAVLGGYANINQLKSLAPRNSAAGLALASYYIQQSQYQNAKDILDAIQPTAIQKTLYTLTLSDWYMAQGQYAQALQTILPLYRIAPENRAVALKLAEIYILNKQPNDANKILTSLSSRFPMDTSVWQLLQRAEDLRVDSPVRAINVLRYRAEVQFWNGQEEEAIKSLLHAQRLNKDNEALKAQIEGRLKQMQDARQLKI
jgi:predicted Zn-dependent protease